MDFATARENRLIADKIVAALLTVALAQGQPTPEPESILGSYKKFLAELSPKPPEASSEPKPGRKFRKP